MDLAETSTDWNKIAGIANIIIALGTIVLAFVAIFGRTFSRWYRRPKLKSLLIQIPLNVAKRIFLTIVAIKSQIAIISGFGWIIMVIFQQRTLKFSLQN